MKKNLFFLSFWAISATCAGVEGCIDQARNEMEKAYCQVEAAGFAAALPTLREFRKNPEKTQRLLLRRPAQRAGVSLPPERKPAAAEANREVAKKPRSAAETSHSAVGDRVELPCQLQENVMMCSKQQYRLLGNQNNSQLNSAALSSATQLSLPDFAGDPADKDALMDYLEEGYRRYIEAMVTIGLAGSTMSFTKFYHTFMEVEAGGANFSKRMATMFEFLKRDKQSIAVKAHFSEERPTKISQCRRLNHAIIICDDVKHNWVFSRN